MEEKLLKIINEFGINNQLKKLNEECYELIETVRDYEDMYIKCDCDSQYLKNEKEHLTEELADCFVLLNQIRLFYKIEEYELDEYFIKKINRTLERIETGYYKENK